VGDFGPIEAAFGFDDPFLEGKAHKACFVAEVEPLHGIVLMPAHGELADIQLLACIHIVMALGDQAYDLELSIRQELIIGIRIFPHVGDDLLRVLGIIDLANHDVVERCKQYFERHLLLIDKAEYAAESSTDGINYKLTYMKPMANGHWQASLGVNQVLTYELKATEDSPNESYLGELVDPRAAGGNIIGRGSIPRYKGYAELIWLRQGLMLGGKLNYIHSLDDNPVFTDDGKSRKIDSWASLDLVASYRWKPSAGAWLSGTTLTCGIDNVTDEAPPFAAGAFADGYDSSLYSLEGRRYRIALSREF